MKNFLRTSVFIVICIGLTPIFNSCKKEKVPTLTTTEVTNITGTTASSGGTITDEGSSTIMARGVCWGPSIHPTISDNKTADGAGSSTFTSEISGLNSTSIYYVRAYATNSVGTGYGNEITFTTNNDLIDKYTLEIDNNYKIYKVTFPYFDNRPNSIIEYIYSLGSIQKTETDSGEPEERVTIYHINNSGFADTSQYSLYYNNEVTNSSISYYIYDSNNYLKMRIDKRTDSYADQTPDTTFYDYNNGNLVKSVWSGGVFGVFFPTSSTYTYNSIKNIVDIESFNGAFIGKLNQNLIESITNYGSPEGVYIRKYQYVLNANGLVEERTSTSSSGGQPIGKGIEKFEYKIKY
jgi:hypothetical protein